MNRWVVLVAIAAAVLSLMVGCASNSEPALSGSHDGNDPADSGSHHPLTPKERVPVFPRSSPPSHLYVYDIRGDSYEMQLLLTTLQGVTSQTEPRIYLLFDTSTDPFWLQEMVDDYGVIYETVADPWTLVDLFVAELDGAIVYDPDLPASVNLATTLAGINQAVVVAPSLLAQAASHGLSVVEDLRGEFADNVEMFTWAMANVWPLANQGILCFSDPRITRLRDYLSAHKILTIMLDPHILDERELLEQILAQTPPNLPLLGWAIDELLGVIVFSQGGKFHVASDGARNMSVTSGLPAPTLSQDHAAFDGQIENKIYLSFALTDGDNVSYSLESLWHMWNDPARGQIPLGWEISFNLLDLGPQAIRYYYETKTPNDMFIGPACGIGYIYPNHYPDLDAFLDLTRPYMQDADMDTIWLINDDLTLPDRYAVAFANGLSLAGIFIDYWPNLDKGFYFASDGTPVLRSQYVYLIGPDQIERILSEKQTEKNFLYPDSPFFLFIGVNGWGTPPTLIKSITDGLSDDFVLLRPDEMFAAMRKAKAAGFEF